MNFQNPDYLNQIDSVQLSSFNNYNSKHNYNTEAMYSNYQQQVSGIQMELDEKDIWQQFYSVTNEMILTKAGR